MKFVPSANTVHNVLFDKMLGGILIQKSKKKNKLSRKKNPEGLHSIKAKIKQNKQVQHTTNI